MLEMTIGSFLKKLNESDSGFVPEVFQKLLASDGTATNYFGISVAASNTSVVIGTHGHLGKGAVYVY